MVIKLGIWKYRSYIWSNSLSDLKNRYAGSSLGAYWNVLQPLLQILLFTFVFSKIMIAKAPGMDSSLAFTIYLSSGLLPWICFADLVSRGSNSLIENATYLKKLSIPEHVFLLQVAVTSSITMFISMGLLLFVAIILGQIITIYWIFAPVVLLLFIVFGLGLALIFACVNVFFRDVSQLLANIIQLWMWLTPIVYVEDLLPDDFLRIVHINPAYYFIDTLHEIIVFGSLPSVINWSVMVVTCLLSISLGIVVYRNLRAEIRDVI